MQKVFAKWLELLAFHMAAFGYDRVSTEREYLCAIRARWPSPAMTGNGTGTAYSIASAT